MYIQKEKLYTMDDVTMEHTEAIELQESVSNEQNEIEKAISEWALNYEPHEINKRPKVSPQDVGKALKTIRDERLYRGEYASFDLYCARRWGMRSKDSSWYISLHEGVQSQPLVTKNEEDDAVGRFVYFIEGAGMIKIGVTDNISKRFNSIRTMSPVPLTLIGYISGDVTVEAKLHKRFSKHRKHGEWFEDCEEIRRYLAKILS